MRLSILTIFCLTLGISQNADATPRVVTDLPPINALVAEVMLGVGAPVGIVGTDANMHHFSLRPSDMEEITSADIIYWTGEAVSPWIAAALDADATPPISVSLFPAEDGHGREEEHGHSEGHHEEKKHGHGEEHGHGEGHHGEKKHGHGEEHGHGRGHYGEEKYGHSEGGHEGAHNHEDQHLWLDPVQADAWLDVIAHHLGEIDPENTALYAANAKRAKAELVQINDQIDALFVKDNEIPALAYHDAYGPFLARFGIEILGTVTDTEDKSPSARHLHKLKKALQKTPPACVLVPGSHDPRLIKTVTKTEPEIIQINPLGRKGQSYANMLLTLAQALADCS